VRLTGAPAAKPGSVIEYDFSVTGPQGVHGPAREQAMIAAGALNVTEADPLTSDRSTRGRAEKKE